MATSPLVLRRTTSTPPPPGPAISSDSPAFLTAKPYLTTIRMPSFALSPRDASTPGATAASPLGSSASSSAFPLKGPWTPARRDSYASCSSSAGSSTECDDSSDEDEAVTPPVSPDLLPADNVDLKGKGKEDPFHFAPLAFSLAEIAEDEDANWAHPVPVVALPAVAPASAPLGPSRGAFPNATARTAFQPAAPDPRQHAAAVRPTPQPSPPTTATGDDEPRGRSRWPRLLWRSELDQDSLVVLKDYHERAIGAPLPILKREMRPRSVARWSRRMEDAGL